jgi:hypothetical protein
MVGEKSARNDLLPLPAGEFNDLQECLFQALLDGAKRRLSGSFKRGLFSLHL